MITCLQDNAQSLRKHKQTASASGPAAGALNSSAPATLCVDAQSVTIPSKPCAGEHSSAPFWRKPKERSDRHRTSHHGCMNPFKIEGSRLLLACARSGQWLLAQAKRKLLWAPHVTPKLHEPFGSWGSRLPTSGAHQKNVPTAAMVERNSWCRILAKPTSAILAV